MALALRAFQRHRAQGGEIIAGLQIEHSEYRAHEWILLEVSEALKKKKARTGRAFVSCGS
jgi:hypothetical protein